MPKLDWLTRPEDERAAASVPYRLLEAVPDLSYGDEQTEKSFNRDVIEKALSHEKQGIRAVYILAEHAPNERGCCNGGPIMWTAS